MDARDAVIGLMVGLPLLTTGIVVWAGLRLKALLARIPRIATKKDLEIYAAEHKLHDMLGTLVKCLLGVANALFFVDLFVLEGPLSDLFYSITPSIVCILASLPIRAIDQKANDLECATDELRKEWNEVRQGP
ncbi:MAG TPA: hypothetical protein VF950_20300 [Planctomycetota bacterium]